MKFELVGLLPSVPTPKDTAFLFAFISNEKCLNVGFLVMWSITYILSIKFLHFSDINLLGIELIIALS